MEELRVNDAFIRNTEMAMKNKINEIIKWVNKQQQLKELLLLEEIEKLDKLKKK